MAEEEKNDSAKVQELSLKLITAEENLSEMRSLRKEDSKACARVVEIFASHRNAWKKQEKRLLHRIDAAEKEIARLRPRVSDSEEAAATTVDDELLNVDKVRKNDASKEISKIEKKQATDSKERKHLTKLSKKREELAEMYNLLSDRIIDLRTRVPSHSSKPSLSSEFRTQSPVEFLVEALGIHRTASETREQLMSLNYRIRKSKYRDELQRKDPSLFSAIKDFKKKQRYLEKCLQQELDLIVIKLQRFLVRESKKDYPA